jgi:hypothetical protein
VVLPPFTVLRKAFTLNERFFLALAMKEEVPEKEGPETPPDSPQQQADEEPESEGGELVEVQQKVPAKSEAKEPTERTDDPVRMYLVPWRGSATFRSRGRLCAAEAGTSSLKSECVPKAVK